MDPYRSLSIPMGPCGSLDPSGIAGHYEHLVVIEDSKDGDEGEEKENKENEEAPSQTRRAKIENRETRGSCNSHPPRERDGAAVLTCLKITILLAAKTNCGLQFRVGDVLICELERGHVATEARLTAIQCDRHARLLLPLLRGALSSHLRCLHILRLSHSFFLIIPTPTNRCVVTQLLQQRLNMF